jgi:4-diphosphocytidyl-2-C-methyl-D-erythritol kinase
LNEQIWPAPAKLNLFLHVTGRRADGYHELQTFFQLIDLNDELSFSIHRNGCIRRVMGPAAIAPADDLVVRAANALRDAAGEPALGVDIRLIKRIPVGAGLGGGSSDAATVLVALNELWGLHWPLERLLALGLTLGADVPFFIGGHNALAAGVGERLTPLDLPARAYSVIFPGVAVSTADIFQASELTRNSPAITIGGSVFATATSLALPGHNDLEPVVVKRYPAVRAALQWLMERAPARMTGSGASVFSVSLTQQAAQVVLQGLPADWLGFAVDGLARSPLLERLAVQRAQKGAIGA